jgi:hypothetical protein
MTCQSLHEAAIKRPVRLSRKKMRASAPISVEQQIVQPEQKFFMSSKAENLRHATLRKTGLFGDLVMIIVAIRHRSSAKRGHFGLAGFNLN